MLLELQRTYFQQGTQGNLLLDGQLVCRIIELPWLKNRRQVSCIPEGEYILQKRYSNKFKWHLHLQNVCNRSMILIHPANDAKAELQGCIAPVKMFTGIGRGKFSRKSLQKLTDLVFPILDKNIPVKLKITTPLS